MHFLCSDKRVICVGILKLTGCKQLMLWLLWLRLFINFLFYMNAEILAWNRPWPLPLNLSFTFVSWSKLWHIHTYNLSYVIWWHIPKDSILCFYHCENPKSHSLSCCRYQAPAATKAVRFGVLMMVTAQNIKLPSRYLLQSWFCTFYMLGNLLHSHCHQRSPCLLKLVWGTSFTSNSLSSLIKIANNM
jgi:hypothetical protein